MRFRRENLEENFVPFRPSPSTTDRQTEDRLGTWYIEPSAPTSQSHRRRLGACGLSSNPERVKAMEETSDPIREWTGNLKFVEKKFKGAGVVFVGGKPRTCGWEGRGEVS